VPLGLDPLGNCKKFKSDYIYPNARVSPKAYPPQLNPGEPNK